MEYSLSYTARLLGLRFHQIQTLVDADPEIKTHGSPLNGKARMLDQAGFERVVRAARHLPRIAQPQAVTA